MYHKKNRNINSLISTIKYYPTSLKILKSLNILNSSLTLSIIILSVYIIVKPLIPEVSFIINKDTNQTILYSNLSSNTSSIINPMIVDTNKDYSFKGYSLDPNLKKIKIDNIVLESNIYSNDDSNSLYKGIWHKANSGNPIKGGNMIITAHRFMYTSNNDSFYHLPKLKKDDIITITWEGEEYNYKISETKVVTPNEIEIEAPTQNHQLTLYTCTPLWTSTHRFVVIANPV